MTPKSSGAIPPAGLSRHSGRCGSFPHLGRVVLLAVSLVLSLLLAEGALRLFFRDRLVLVQDERSLLYRYDSQLGWFPVPNSRNHFFASRDILVTNNSEGFRGPERRVDGKPGVLFLGDSFVWGYDAQAEERFTDKLQARHPEWNIYNLGVSGYGTDQELLLLERQFDRYKPRVVFLVYSVETDEDDNCTNLRYGGYYKPYCTVTANNLELRGVPVPKSARAFWAEHSTLARSYLLRLIVGAWFRVLAPPELHNPSPTGAIIRTMQKLVERKGAVFVMGLTDTNPRMEEFLKQCGIHFVNLATPLRYASYGWHWTPEGHVFVCGKVEEFLTEGKYLREDAAAH